MVNIQAVSAVLSSFKAMSDIARSLVGLRDAELIREKIISLQSLIIDAQQAAIDAQQTQSELQQRIRDLESQIRKRVEKPCPICGQPLHTKNVEPHRTFGDMGVQTHTLQCACGHTEERMVDPTAQK